MNDYHTPIPEDPSNPGSSFESDASDPGAHGSNSYGSVTPSTYYTSPAPVKPKDENPWSGVGKVGMIIAIIVLVVGIPLAIWLGFDSAELSKINRAVPQPAEVDARFEELLNSVFLLGFGIGLLSLVGIAGLITSMIGITSRRGRSAGIWGLILGLIAPFVILGSWAAVFATQA